MKQLRLRRADMSRRQRETWRPPLFRPSVSRLALAMASTRRAFDLQASSIWRDMGVLLPPRRGVVLDVGCGAQPYRSFVSTEATYVGIDTANAAAHFGYELPDTIYFSGDRWPVEDASVGTILATETLEHVLDPAVFLAEARRCLAPGGGLVLTVPFSARWHFIPHDYWRFTPSSLVHLLSNAGFRDLAVYARGNELTVACYKIATLVLTWLLGVNQHLWRGRILRICAVALLPVLLIVVIVGQLTLLSADGSEDCLGYTVLGSVPSDDL